MTVIDIILKVKASKGNLENTDLAELKKRIDTCIGVKSNSIKCHIQKEKIGEFYCIDPSIGTILISIGNSALGVLIIKGIIEIILEWQKNNSNIVEITIGDNHFVIPQNIKEDNLKKIIKQVEKIQKLDSTIDNEH